MRRSLANREPEGSTNDDCENANCQTKCEVRTANREVRTTKCDPRTANCEVRTAKCEPRTANCEPYGRRTAKCEVRTRSTNYGSRKRHARFTFWIPRSAIHVLSSRSVLAPPLRSCFAVHVIASRFLRAIHVCTVAGSVTTRVVRVFPDYARCILPLRCSQFLQAHVSMSSYYGRPAGTKRVCHCMC